VTKIATTDEYTPSKKTLLNLLSELLKIKTIKIKRMV
jgi:hypothetical protein